MTSPFIFMIQNIVDLFISLFNGVLNFSDIVLLLTAIATLAVVVTIFRYILKGKY